VCGSQQRRSSRKTLLRIDGDGGVCDERSAVALGFVFERFTRVLFRMFLCLFFFWLVDPKLTLKILLIFWKDLKEKNMKGKT
jgi:hypothetical protein